jgi:solute carrier family 25 (mitochondrial thiamine pyrophosphate transporter), member 19
MTTVQEPSSSSEDENDTDDDSGEQKQQQQQQQQQQTHYPSWHSVVAGGVAGFGSRMATAPLDFFRIRRQLNLAPDAHGIWQGLSHVYRNEGGLIALYRGNLAAIGLWIGYAACQFSVYHRVKECLPSSSSSSTSQSSSMIVFDNHTRAFVAGAAAGSVALLVTYPLDVCRTHMVAHGILTKHLVFSSLYDPQTLPSKAVGTKAEPVQTLTSCARTLYQSRGMAGFYAGVRPAFVQIIPYMGINFALYEALSSSSHDTSVGLAAYAGSISGAVSKMIVYPLDTVKRRLQAQAFRDGSAMIIQRYDGMVDCFVRVARQEGVTGFYRGIVPSVLKTGLATSMSFAIFRWTTNRLEDGHDHFVLRRVQQ